MKREKIESNHYQLINRLASVDKMFIENLSQSNNLSAKKKRIFLSTLLTDYHYHEEIFIF